MNNLKEAFGQKVKELRKKQSLTQEALAEMLNLSPRQLIRIENGENFPSAETLCKITSALKVPIKNLFDLDWNEKISCLTIKISKKNEELKILQNTQTRRLEINTNQKLTLTNYEQWFIELSKHHNKPITTELYKNKDRVEIKTFFPNGEIETILTEDEIKKGELYSYIKTQLDNFYEDESKLNFIKLTIESLENKDAQQKLMTILQGMHLISNQKAE